MVYDRWWGGAESLIKSQLKSNFAPARILTEAISMTRSDMLYQLDIFTFYFYEPFLIQIFVPRKFIKTLAFTCLLSLLTVNRHADNHIYKYIYLFQILYSMKQFFFLLKYTLRLFIFIRTIVYRKNSLRKKIVFL